MCYVLHNMLSSFLKQMNILQLVSAGQFCEGREEWNKFFLLVECTLQGPQVTFIMMQLLKNSPLSLSVYKWYSTVNFPKNGRTELLLFYEATEVYLFFHWRFLHRKWVDTGTNPRRKRYTERGNNRELWWKPYVLVSKLWNAKWNYVWERHRLYNH